jgi:hypothetical protein
MAALLQTLVAHPDDTDEARRPGMRDPSASVEPPSTSSSSTFALPDADLAHAVWTNLPLGAGFPTPAVSTTATGLRQGFDMHIR